MADIWPSGYGDSDECEGLAGGWISVAPKNGTTEVWIRWSSDGIDWSSEAVFAVDYTDTARKKFHVHYDGVYVWITNGVDRIWRSTKYGKAGTWAAH